MAVGNTASTEISDGMTGKEMKYQAPPSTGNSNVTVSRIPLSKSPTAIAQSDLYGAFHVWLFRASVPRSISA